MARFRLKPMVVEAEPYRLGLEDGFTSQTVPVLVTQAGRLELAEGDWIVTKASGEREVMNGDAFRSLYERCSSDQEAQTSDRARRGIPLRSG